MKARSVSAVAVVLLTLSSAVTAATTVPPEAATYAAADKDDLPTSKDDLFGTGTETDKKDTPVGKGGDSAPASKEELFGADLSVAAKKAEPTIPLHGFAEGGLAYTYASPAHWSDVLGRLQIGTSGRIGEDVKWKATGRVEYNAVYDLTDFYAANVEHDQRARFQFEETYLDFSGGGLDWRVGRQQIVWGEMVGLFFADVVSAKDLREFVLSDFNILRIPQWAARAEYFNEDFHAEAVWIPFPSYDLIGTPRDPSKPGAGSDFYPYPPAVSPTILGEVKPSTSLDHGNFGIRANQLVNGWDLAAFYYTSMNSAPTFYQYTPNVFTPEHDRIWQAGGTLGKDMGGFVLKAEAVYTQGQRFNLLVPVPGSNGVVKQNTLDWVIGLDFNPSNATRVNTQLFQRVIFDHNSNIIPDRYESGASLLLSHDIANNWKAEALLIHSLNRSDWMLRPKAIWAFQPNWKLTFGLDMFGGPPTGFFGQYDQDDRGYVQVRYDF
jgi:hypothetical protein